MVSETTKDLLERAAELRDLARENEKRDKLDGDMKDIAISLALLRDNLVKEGFTQEEAYDLVRLTVSAVGGKK